VRWAVQVADVGAMKHKICSQNCSRNGKSFVPVTVQHAVETPYTTWRIRFTCSSPRQQIQTRISITLRSCLFALTVPSLGTWIFSQNYLYRIGIKNRFILGFWQGSATFFLYRNSSYFKRHICYATTDNPISTRYWVICFRSGILSLITSLVPSFDTLS